MIDQYIAEYGRRLYGLCLTLCRDKFDADDLYQETWLKVCRKIEKYDVRRPFESWLTGICVNTYRDILRRRKRSPLYDDFISHEEKDAVMERASAGTADDLSRVRDAVDMLPEKLRTVVILFYFHDLDTAHTAEALGIPPGTVKSRLSKARKLIKEVLKSETDI